MKTPRNKITFEGPVRYIDEKREDIKKSQIGLIVPYNIIKGFQQENKPKFLFETKLEIKSLKSKGEINQKEMPFESENCETKEPIKKKIKIENNN